MTPLVTGSNSLLGTKPIAAATGRWRTMGMDFQPDPVRAGDPFEYVRCDATDRFTRDTGFRFIPFDKSLSMMKRQMAVDGIG